MSRVVKFFLWILLVLFLAVAIVGGTLYYFYAQVDEKAIEFPSITFAGQEISGGPASGAMVDWNEPVLGGVMYKKIDPPTAAIARVLDTVTENSVPFTAPKGWSAEVTITPNGDGIGDGGAQNYTGTGNEQMIPFTRNGSYQFKAVLTRAKEKGKGWGSVTYAASLAVDAAAKIEFSSTTAVIQGGVLNVVVENIMDNSIPTIETEMGLAQFVKVNDKYIASVGVHYNKEGSYPVTVTCGALTQTQTIEIAYRDFTRQDLTIEDTGDGEINEAASPAAYAQYRKVVMPFFDTADSTRYWSGTFTPPLVGKLNTEYGLRRYVNGSTTATRHAGIDLDGNLNDPISAPAAGRVVLSELLLNTGNTVIIEHGGGLKSYFFHMNELRCKVDDVVKQGDIIGLLGSTGYSTGPHMHYEARIGNQSIDPMALFDGTSSIYFEGEASN